MFWAFLLLAASAQGNASLAELANESFRVQPHDYRYIDARISHWPATLICNAVAGGAGLRVELLTHEELFNFVRGREHDFVLSLDQRRNPGFSQALPNKGEYAIVLVNDDDAPVEVRLEASVQFAREPGVAEVLSPNKRLAVILISLLVFLTTVSWSAWKLVAAMRRAQSSMGLHD